MDSTIDKACFDELKDFLVSWGLYPSEEPLNGDASLGNADGEYIINTKCYERMCEVAVNEYGDDFRSFISRMIEATDGEFYLNAKTWDEVLECWEDAL